MPADGVIGACCRMTAAAHRCLAANKREWAEHDVDTCRVNNDGEEDLELLVMGQRLEQDVADYPDRGKRIYRHADGWDLVDHGAIESITPTLPKAGDDK